MVVEVIISNIFHQICNLLSAFFRIHLKSHVPMWEALWFLFYGLQPLVLKRIHLTSNKNASKLATISNLESQLPTSCFCLFGCGYVDPKQVVGSVNKMVHFSWASLHCKAKNTLTEDVGGFEPTTSGLRAVRGGGEGGYSRPRTSPLSIMGT